MKSLSEDTNRIIEKVFNSNKKISEKISLSPEEIKKLEFLKFMEEHNGIPIENFEKILNVKNLGEYAKFLSFHKNMIFLNKNGKEEIKKIEGKYDNTLDKIKNEVERVEFYPAKTNDESGFFRIEIKDKKIEINIEDMVSPTKFCSMYYDRFKEYIKISNKGEESEWKKFMNYLGENCVTCKTDYIDSEQFVVDEIISKIQKCTITRDIEKTRVMWNYLYLNENKLYYPSTNIKKVIKDAKFGIKLRKLRSLLDPYLIDNTLVKRVGESTERFWVFNPKKLNIDIEKRLEEDDNDKK